MINFAMPGAMVRRISIVERRLYIRGGLRRGARFAELTGDKSPLRGTSEIGGTISVFDPVGPTVIANISSEIPGVTIGRNLFEATHLPPCQNAGVSRC